MNPARTDHVFEKSHTYFKEMDSQQKFGRKAYGLQKITDLEAEKGKNLINIPQKTPEDYQKFWKSEVKRIDLDKTDLVYTNYLGINYRLPSKNLLKKFERPKYKGQNREGIAFKVEEILQNPDEVWMQDNSNKSKAIYKTNHIKRYKDGWYNVVTGTESEDLPEVITWYKINNLGVVMKGLPIKTK